ncbi:MAG: HlyD family efflux transporter periplasmic adaptor subunit, partial [Opitutaceae bacterium]|nr:HlyD family efflux transporter periplasmic adaptor subunit [Opitutaceae bacterium]
PLEGELLEWVSLEKGSVVMAGQALGRLTPDEPLLIEAFVPARTAALLHPRQGARASFPALPAAEWGTLALQVEAIASDARWERGEPLFRVVARPAVSRLTTRDGRSQPLRKGFVAEVRFHLGRTTLFQFLRTKTTDWIQRTPVARVPAGSVRTTLSLALRRLHSGRPGLSG